MKIFLYLGFLAALALGDPLEPRTYNLKVKIAIGLPTYDYELPTDVSSYLEGGMHDGLTTFLDENTAGILAAVEGTEGYSLDYVAVDSVDYPITCPAGYEAEPACGTFSFIVTITGPGGDPYEFASYLEAWLETVGLLVIKAKLENYYQAPYKLLKAYIYVIKGGGAMDDPHFLTWFGDWYDFMGQCDLHLLIAPFFSPDKPLVVDIRTRTRYDYSYIESAAVKIGDEILEVSSWGEYWLSGVEGALQNDNEVASISGFPIQYTQVDDKIHKFVIQIAEEESIVVKTFKDMVSVKVDNANAARFHGSQGMMGDFTTGKLLARDGATIVEDPNALAAEWQIRNDEAKLFQTAGEVQYPQACQLPDAIATETGRRLGEHSITFEAAEEACNKSNTVNKKGCIHDVIATGDLDLAAAGAF